MPYFRTAARAAMFALALLSVSCDSQRLAKLEAENKDLRQQIDGLKRTNNLDVQAKCAKDAREFFNKDWATGRDDKTQLLDFSNHYNESMNRCFILINYNFLMGSSGWSQTASLYDVYDHLQVGDFAALNIYRNGADQTTVNRCSVAGIQCTSGAEFNERIRPFMFAK
ncbi:MAG TPA: hypothetical protein VJN96_20850 [Vicinamibacterales bacterium]|nr:hypothetical protein [Vicinamibacterales bacterium]